MPSSETVETWAPSCVTLLSCGQVRHAASAEPGASEPGLTAQPDHAKRAAATA